jgi:succinate-semialdehyde dehydrogenase/glutarate-semialdehyde dehydrogenase
MAPGREGTGTIPVTNPADGEEVIAVANGTAEHARIALDAAARAQPAWGRTAPRQRANLMHAAHRLMLEREEIIVHAMTLESGKPLTEARAEFKLSTDFLLWFAEQTAHLHGSYAMSSHGGFRVMVARQPVGPCLLITPWNFPLLMIVRKAGAALAAGCTTITKSAKETPMTGALFTQILHDAGFPAGTVNLIHTQTSSEISETLLADPRLRKVSFTGSTEVGSHLLGLAARNIVNASMELGGDGPFIVLDDADVDLAVDHAIICKFRNAGQACVAANRIIVDRKVEGAFTGKFVERVRALKVGDGMEAVDVGPMISAKQRDRLYDTIQLLSRAGGEVLTGGRAIQRPGYFFEPTVVRFDARTRRCAPTSCSRRSPPSSPSTGFDRRSISPTIPGSASPPTSSRATSPARWRSANSSSSAWSASIAASWPILPRPSVASRHRGSDARPGRTEFTSSWNRSTWP